MTLNCYSQLANYSGEMQGWLAKILLDKFNVKINVIPESNGVYETKMQEGDLGDIVIWGSDGDDYTKVVAAECSGTGMMRIFLMIMVLTLQQT